MLSTVKIGAFHRCSTGCYFNIKKLTHCKLLRKFVYQTKGDKPESPGRSSSQTQLGQKLLRKFNVIKIYENNQNQPRKMQRR